jgi:hypothetical protein
MDVPNNHPKCISPSADEEQIAQPCGPVLLRELELDCTTGAGSKPGMVGDGRSPLQTALFVR